MDDIGLYVEFDGTKNVVMLDGIVKEYPIGGMACEYARLRPTELKAVIMECPLFSETNIKEKGAEALMWFYEKLKEKRGMVIATMIIGDFSNLLADYNMANEEELCEILASCNEDKGRDKVKEFILENSGYDEFGIETIGQAFLTAYSTYALSYVGFRYTFEMLASEDEFDEDKVDLFFSMYGENTDFQHIDYRLMLYDKKFHSVYKIKTSISLIIFEAAHAMDAEAKFVKCKNCGEYFVPTGRSDSLYCGYPSPQDKSKACRDIGAKATRAKKMKNDIVTQEYRRLYMRLKMAVKRHPDGAIYQQQFKALTSEMKRLRKRKESGAVSSDDILEWLQEFEDNYDNNN